MRKILFFLSCVTVLGLSGCAHRYVEGPEVSVPTGRGRYTANVAASTVPSSGQTIRIFIDGQVKDPGEYSLPDNATLWTAIQAAGGPSIFAAIKDTELKRNNRVIVPSFQKRNRAGKSLVWFGPPNSTADFPLQNGDVIIIPLLFSP